MWPHILIRPNNGDFRVKSSVLNKLRRRKRRILRRIENRPGPERERPMIAASNIHYELGDRVQGLGPGGIGAMLLLARRTGLIADIDHYLHLFKCHRPYHESDHVLNIALNILAGGTKLQHIERLRNDEAYLNALDAQRIPDPTTAGDFCRRFLRCDVLDLMDAVNRTRKRIWAQQPVEFFDQALIDVDGTLVGTDAECKEGVDIAYDGTWSYHPLLVSLANTKEPLYLVNRSGNRPSHELAASFIDRAVLLCRQAGFRSFFVRGTPTSPRPSISIVGMKPAISASSLASMPGPIWWPWPSNCRTRRTASWSGRYLRSRPCRGSDPHGTKHESSRSGASRPFTRSRRWLPSSLTGRWLATGIIA